MEKPMPKPTRARSRNRSAKREGQARPLTLAVLAAAAALALAYFAATGSRPDVRKPFDQITVFDTSVSNRDRLEGETVAYSSNGSRLPKGSAEIVFRIDSRLERIPGEGPRASDEEFVAEVRPQLDPRSEHDNTYLDIAFAKLASMARKSSRKVAILIYTDYAKEGMDAPRNATLRFAVKDLASNPKVALVIIAGADPINSQVMDADLAPLGSKLRTPPADADIAAIVTEAGA